MVRGIEPYRGGNDNFCDLIEQSRRAIDTGKREMATFIRDEFRKNREGERTFMKNG
jgi:hypothetical protein